MERLDKPLAERPRRDYSAKEPEQAQQILQAVGWRQRLLWEGVGATLFFPGCILLASLVD